MVGPVITQKLKTTKFGFILGCKFNIPQITGIAYNKADPSSVNLRGQEFKLETAK